jgi:hypothetical protein
MDAKRFLEVSEFIEKKYPIFALLAYFEGFLSSRVGGRLEQNYIVTEICFPSPQAGDGNLLSVPMAFDAYSNCGEGGEPFVLGVNGLDYGC